MTNIYPIDDIYAHRCTELCECSPTVDPQSGVVIHHAYDAREFQEMFPDDEWFYVTPHTPSRHSH